MVKSNMERKYGNRRGKKNSEIEEGNREKEQFFSNFSPKQMRIFFAFPLFSERKTLFFKGLEDFSWKVEHSALWVRQWAQSEQHEQSQRAKSLQACIVPTERHNATHVSFYYRDIF